MKRLLVLRHAKSEWNAGAPGGDHERPLNARGERAAARVGRLLAVGGLPQKIVCSSAVRVVSTVELAARAGEWVVPTEIRRELYGASPAGVLRIVARAEQSIDHLLVAGHEPTCSMLVGGLIGQAQIVFPTAALARIDLPIARWSEVAFGGGSLRWLVTPKMLRRAVDAG